MSRFWRFVIGNIRQYEKAINLLVLTRYADEQEENIGSKLLVKLYSNAIICHYKLHNFKRICTLSSDAYRDHHKEASKSHKIKYFWGMSKMMLGDYKDARKLLRDAKSIAPNNEEIAKGLAQVAKKEQENIEREKVMFKKMIDNKAKIVEVDEEKTDEDDEFAKDMKAELEKYAKSPGVAPMIIRNPLTRKEEIACLNVVTKLGLYGRIIDSSASRYIEITKPDE